MPKNVKELQSFLGLVSYYHQMFSSTYRSKECQKSEGEKEVEKKVTTLDKAELTKSTFFWMSQHQVALDTLKITTAPVFGYSNFTREFILETDVSLVGLGVVLSQQDNTSKDNTMLQLMQVRH